jgi:hypothetical protein
MQKLKQSEVTDPEIEELKRKIKEQEEELEEMEVKTLAKKEPRTTAIEEKEQVYKVMVVRELPTQEIKEVKDKNGNIIRFITIEEALTELLNQ